MTTVNFFDAVLASVRLNRIYGAAISAYGGHCMVSGTPKAGYHIQLVLARKPADDLFPQQMGEVPIALICADIEQHLETEHEEVLA